MAAVSTYTARVTREGRWWVVDVDGIGVTQARSLPDAQVMAADLVSALRDVDVAPSDVELLVDIGSDIVSAAHAAQQRARAAAKALAVAADDVRAQAQALRHTGFTGKDAAFVLGISEQRVSQLVGKSLAKGREAPAASPRRSVG